MVKNLAIIAVILFVAFKVIGVQNKVDDAINYQGKEQEEIKNRLLEKIKNGQSFTCKDALADETFSDEGRFSIEKNEFDAMFVRSKNDNYKYPIHTCE